MYVLIALGIVILFFAFSLICNPEAGFKFGRKYFLSPKFQYGAGIVSLLIAVVVYYSASSSKFPALFELLAMASLLGGAIVFVLPQKYYKNIVSWELDTFSPFGRALGLVYALLGTFVVYAAI